MKSSCLMLIAMLLTTAVAVGQDNSRGASKAGPDTPEQATKKVLAAYDAAALGVLAKIKIPDPWMVADLLCAQDKFDAAQAFVRGHEKWKHPYYWAAWQLWVLPD